MTHCCYIHAAWIWGLGCICKNQLRSVRSICLEANSGRALGILSGKHVTRTHCKNIYQELFTYMLTPPILYILHKAATYNLTIHIVLEWCVCT